jgi:hypothetical protein
VTSEHAEAAVTGVTPGAAAVPADPRTPAGQAPAVRVTPGAWLARDPGAAAAGPPASDPSPATAAEHPASEGPTGHPAVDAALQELDRATGLPTAEQVGAYEAAHRALQQTLATIDQA